EHQPGLRGLGLRRRDLGGLERRALRAGEILRLIFEVRGLREERARALVRVLRRAMERVDDLAEVLPPAPALEQTHERFERLAEARIAVVRGEVVLRGAGLVARALLDLAYLAEQPSLARLVGRGRNFEAKLGDGPLDFAKRAFGCRRRSRNVRDGIRRG